MDDAEASDYFRSQALLWIASNPIAAASLFAVNGFNRVSLEDLGAAAGVSGPAVYRHFPGKQAVLGALLLTVSQDLLLRRPCRLQGSCATGCGSSPATAGWNEKTT